MTAPPLDDFLLRYAPAEPLQLDPGLLRARQSLGVALAALVRVPDAAVEKPWPWRGADADVRYGLYHQYEALDEARAHIRPLLAGVRAVEPPARPLAAAVTTPRWELVGLLAGLSDDDLDRDPGDGEWTVRQTLGHIVSAQRAYGWFSAWWHATRDRPADELPERVPDDIVAASGLPDESVEAGGSVAEITTRLHDVVDQSAAVFASLGDDGLAARARWAGYPVDLRFRLLRWPSHVREHTVQIDKTLLMVGRPTSEVERIVRLVAGAYGRLEEELFMWPAAESAVARASMHAAERLADVAAGASSVREAADG